ncbi:MAG: hypothetical protein ACK47B_03200 [Armatimonadota bacterium]
MKRTRRSVVLGIGSAACGVLVGGGCRSVEPARAAAAAPVELVRPPDGGIQPQVAVDASGQVHLLYYQGQDASGDLFYTRRPAAGGEWAAPLRVNSVPGSAVAAGTIRGGQLALGKGGRPHVVWFGSSRAEANPLGGAPVLYSRLSEAGTTFEPQRPLMHASSLLDGGPGIAADRRGGVYVAWHGAEGAVAPGKPGPGEEKRRVWMAQSADDGRTFAAERAVETEPTGACPCCLTKVFADSSGGVYVLYRTADGKVNRDTYLLSSGDAGKSFRGAQGDRWKIDT